MANLVRTFICFLVTYTMLFVYTTGETYSYQFDGIDIDGILANPRLRNQYVNCIMSTAPCVTGGARFLKENFAEALTTKCKKCTERQVNFFNKITEWFTTNEPETWNRAVQIALQEIQHKNI